MVFFFCVIVVTKCLFKSKKLLCLSARMYCVCVLLQIDTDLDIVTWSGFNSTLYTRFDNCKLGDLDHKQNLSQEYYCITYYDC